MVNCHIFYSTWHCAIREYSAVQVVRFTAGVSGRPTRGGGLAALFRQSVPIRVHQLASKIEPMTFDLQLLHVRIAVAASSSPVTACACTSIGRSGCRRSRASLMSSPTSWPCWHLSAATTLLSVAIWTVQRQTTRRWTRCWMNVLRRSAWRSSSLNLLDARRLSLPTFRRHLKTLYFQSAYPPSAAHLA